MLTMEINGRPAEAEDLHRVATWTYGHVTPMQVRDGAVRGLDLHLRRLAHASRELFGETVEHDAARIRELVRHGLRDQPAASLRVTEVLGPEAPVLSGITMQLLQAALTRSGVPWSTRPPTRENLPVPAGRCRDQLLLPRPTVGRH